MQILRENILDNGLKLTFYNASKPVAGDRWLVELKILSKIPLSEKMISDIATNEACEFLLNKFDGELVFELERKVHFVDEKLVDETLEKLIELAQSNMVEYFGHPDFVERLFSKKMEELQQQYVLEENLKQNEKVPVDVDEPADFSACFK